MAGFIDNVHLCVDFKEEFLLYLQIALSVDFVHVAKTPNFCKQNLNFERLSMSFNFIYFASANFFYELFR